jgi:hypothetical protein
MDKLTPDQRSALAKRAVNAREAKRKQEKRAGRHNLIRFLEQRNTHQRAQRLAPSRIANYNAD